MKTRAYVMLGIALLLAGASVFLARNWVQNQVQPVAAIEDQKRLETTKVIVASTQLHFGNKVRREHLRVVDWPTAAVPEGSFKSIDEILGKEEVDEKTGVKKKAEDRTALRTIEVNEPILKSKITGFGGRASLSTLIAPGMRATTIRVNDVSGVAGFVLPGDRVDVLLTRDPESGKRRGGNLQTDVFLQNMKVLAIAQDANQDRNKAAVVKAVTLEVTPTQAQKLTLAQKLGSLSLALRHINTVNAEAPQSIKARDLSVGEANLAPKPKAPDSGTTTATVADPVTFEAAMQGALWAVTARHDDGGYVLVVLVTAVAPREIIGIAYDSGGVTTSTITVPLVTALGVGLASSMKGRNPMVDGFGLIAFASLTPMIFVMIYGLVI